MAPDRDHGRMLRAVAAAAAVRGTTSPNPWVGCLIVTAAGAATARSTVSYTHLTLPTIYSV